MKTSKLSLLGIAGFAMMAGFTACNNASDGDSTKQIDSTVQNNTVSINQSTYKDDSLFVKDASGLECKWVTRSSGTQTAAIGDIASVNVIFRVGDSVLVNTYEKNNNQPVPQQITAPAMEGDLMSGFVKMKAGDSAVFRMPVETYFSRINQPKPSWAKPGDYMVWEVKMESIMNASQMAAQEAIKNKAQNDIDDKLLQTYFKSHNIKNYKKTASGMYYTVSKSGVGAHPKAGQQATVNYTGQNLKGVKFDSNVDPAFSHVQPFQFTIGQGVIPGWSQAVPLMNKGMKATFYLPSSLAYGPNGSGDKIGPNEILAFDIELVDFK